MIPPAEALTGDPTAAGPGAQLAMMDMSKCAFFVYVDTDGRATVQADGVPKDQAAQWMRTIAASFDAESGPIGPQTFRSPSGYVELVVHPWDDSQHDTEALSDIEFIIEALRSAYLAGHDQLETGE